MAPRSLWSTVSLLLLLTPAVAEKNNFYFYPKNSQQCLYDSANDAGCNSGSISKLNTCLCGNNNDFVINTAKCVGEKDYADVDDVYSTMSGACDDSNTPLSVTKKQFLAAAEEGKNGTSSSTSASASASTGTSTATTTSSAGTTTSGGHSATAAPTETSGSDDNSSGLSTGATIGIGVGAAAAGAGIVGALIFFLLRRRRRRGEEAHPMLSQGSPSTAPSHGYYDPKTASWVGGATTPSPDPSKVWQQQSPIPPLSQQNTGPYAVQQPEVAELPLTHAQVFEMDGASTQRLGSHDAVEMPGSTVQR